jgi:hypothetical protein
MTVNCLTLWDKTLRSTYRTSLKVSTPAASKRWNVWWWGVSHRRPVRLLSKGFRFGNSTSSRFKSKTSAQLCTINCCYSKKTSKTDWPAPSPTPSWIRSTKSFTRRKTASSRLTRVQMRRSQVNGKLSKTGCRSLTKALYKCAWWRNLKSPSSKS